MTITHLPATFQGSPDVLGEPWLGYIRVSTYKEEQISPELQREAIEQWARRTGRRIIDWVIDLDVSGRHFKRRIVGAIERVEAGEARGIAVWRYSRFGRNRTGNAANLARLEAVGGQLESATEPIDARTAVGELQREMIFAFGNFESNRAGEQWTEAHDHRRSNGLPATGRPRFGYIWHPRRLPDGKGGWILQRERYEPDPELDGVNATLYDRYIAGEGFTKLVRYLNGAGYTTVNGNAWAVSTLARWMDSGFAAGLLRVHAADCPCDGRHCNRYDYIKGAHEPVIATTREAAAEKWRVYLKRRQAAQRMAPRELQGSYTLTGLMRCGRCRGACRIVAFSSKKRRIRKPGYSVRCLKHSHAGETVCKGVWSRRTVVEAAVFEWLAEGAADGIDAVPGEAERPRTPNGAAVRAKRRAKLEADHDQAEAAIARLMVDRAKAPDLYPEETFRVAKAELERDRDRAMEALGELKAEEEEGPTFQDCEPVVVGLLLEWTTLPTQARNAILRQLIRRVVLAPIESDGGDSDKPHYRYEVHPVWEPDPWAEPQEEAAEAVGAPAS
ncbi:recombinase family protein [Streptomyces sp. NBC_01808]|uniref:recombinase family protein n=1 Tax=Streptomyces sp. NBC_01808 TaxID=2975947 RepID=UPI002DDB900E|nr:recombinase family protein [Streptomyces sp. NBC_01808]WSA39510.1 recombinase family protein [Streptomyces sp. NBC_01808]